MSTKFYRYPGVRPFTFMDSDIFFGRDEEIKKLYKLILLESVVVIFGKSGYGKSSLINAGILPLINQAQNSKRSNYHPIEVRIGKVAGQDVSLVEKVLSKLDEQFPDLENWSFLDEFEDLPLLWYRFKKKQSRSTQRVILIFDQFEEFFTYSAKEQEAFRWELAELMSSSLPRKIQEKIDVITDERYNQLSSGLDIKILLSIRADRLSSLHSMKDAFPNILANRFEVKALGLQQAREAIVSPALKKDTKFVTHEFTYDENALAIILRELQEMKSQELDSIETFHLQIICQACEAKVEEKLKSGIVDREINEEDLPEFRNLYEDYYKRQIEKLPEEYRHQIQAILENELIYEDAETGEHHRLSVDGNILRRELTRYEVPESVLGNLENTFLIRREPNTVGGFSYEIAHETILEPILLVKHERVRAEEAKVQAELVRRETLKEAARKRRKNTLWIGLVGVVVLIVAYYRNTIYFGYITYLNSSSQKPIVRLKDDLGTVTDSLMQQMMENARKINYSDGMASWTSSQIMGGLYGKVPDSLVRNFFHLTTKAMIDTLCGWVEMAHTNDFRASGWVVSTIGRYNLNNKYRCNVIEFFLRNQLVDGAWSMFKMDRANIKFGSTYATCHVLRALHNSADDITDVQLKQQVETAIQRGGRWLLQNLHDTATAIWGDYPKEQGFESVLSISLSGLAIHTLDLIGMGSPALNRKWLENLKLSQAALEINHIERSDMIYQTNVQGAEFRDPTRHLVVPWEIIATVDAYRSGSFKQKVKANIWLDKMIKNLDIGEISHTPVFVRAEIFIALRYLRDADYIFQ